MEQLLRNPRRARLREKLIRERSPKERTMNDASGLLIVVSGAFVVLLFQAGLVDASPYPVRNTNPPWYEASPANAPKLKVPNGCTNLAAGKPVTSSDKNPIIGKLKQITDGDKRWHDGCYVELAPGKQYVQINLQTNATIHAVWLWHYYSWVPNVDVPNDVVVLLGSEPTFTNNVTTVFNCDKDNSLGLGKGKDEPFGTSTFGKIVDVNAVQARFVRVYGRGGYIDELTKFVEIEVHGVPISNNKSANKTLNRTN